MLSKAWLLGIFTYAFQMIVMMMIFYDQIKGSIENGLNVPFKVGYAVLTAQLFSICIALATQNDITTSIRLVVMFWKDPFWDRTILGRSESVPPTTTTEWVIHILLPNILKFVQGGFVMFFSFVLIVESDNIIDLLKDFTALMILSETDNIVFALAANGYMGPGLQRKVIEVREMEIQYEVPDSDLAFFSS